MRERAEKGKRERLTPYPPSTPEIGGARPWRAELAVAAGDRGKLMMLLPEGARPGNETRRRDSGKPFRIRTATPRLRFASVGDGQRFSGLERNTARDRCGNRRASEL